MKKTNTVICINDIFTPGPGCEHLPRPAIGDRDKVTDYINKGWIGPMISLDRFGEIYYAEDHFIYVDDEAETIEEAVNKKEEQLCEV